METQPRAHGHWGDTFRKTRHQVAFLCAFVAVCLVFVIIGAFAPEAFRVAPKPAQEVTSPCASASCDAVWEFTTPHLQPFNQFASLSMAVQRPEGASTHVAVDTAVDMRLNITGIDQAGKRHVIEYNRQHARVLTWASGSRASARVSLLSLTSVQYSKLMLTVTMQGPVRDISAAAMTNVT
ncbi:unnamed protein product, partial [Symbiodinium sp. KB8]